MDSSFLTGLHIILSVVTTVFFLKLLIQFGLPNHPTRLFAYIVGLCTTSYFVGLSCVDFGVVSPLSWQRWRVLPLVAGSLCLLLQTILLLGQFSLIQQKVFSRIPLMAALLGFAFFYPYADYFTIAFILIGSLILIISVQKARLQKRLYLKMTLMFLLFLVSGLLPYVAVPVSGIFLLLMLFYLFQFEHLSGISAMMDDFRYSLEEETR